MSPGIRPINPQVQMYIADTNVVTFILSIMLSYWDIPKTVLRLLSANHVSVLNLQNFPQSSFTVPTRYNEYRKIGLFQYCSG